MSQIQLNSLKINKAQLRAELSKRSFFYFLKEFWEVLIPEAPIYNWHIEYICNELQEIAERVFKREPKKYDLIINVPPGSTKSTIASKYFPVWCWINDPSLRFISGSYAADLALSMNVKSRDLILSDKFQDYFSDIFQLKSDQSVKSHYENTKGGDRIATSVGGSITGQHAHIIVIDDPIDPLKSLSDKERDKANDWLDSTLSSRKIDPSITPTILIMQRLHESDCTGHILSQGEPIKHICIPAEESDNIQPEELRKFYINGLFDPTRFSKEILESYKTKMGSRVYSGQMMQTPKQLEGGLFKREWFQIVDSAPQEATRVRFWDMAATESKQGKDPDYTVGARMSKDSNGIYYIEDIRRVRKSPLSVEKLIKQTAELDTIKTLIRMEQEPGSSGVNTIDHYSRVVLSGFTFKGIKSTGSKLERALPISAAAEAGNIKIVRGAWNQAFLDEVDLFPAGNHDDQVDSVSGAFNELNSASKIFIGRV